MTLDDKKLNFILAWEYKLEESMENPMIDPNFFADTFANCYFPIIEGMPFEMEEYSFQKNWLTVYDCLRNKLQKYEENCVYMLNRHLSKDMFYDHSLTIMKESLKIFSPYCKSAKPLLEKLEQLE